MTEPTTIAYASAALEAVPRRRVIRALAVAAILCGGIVVAAATTEALLRFRVLATTATFYDSAWTRLSGAARAASAIALTAGGVALLLRDGPTAMFVVRLGSVALAGVSFAIPVVTAFSWAGGSWSLGERAYFVFNHASTAWPAPLVVLLFAFIVPARRDDA